MPVAASSVGAHPGMVGLVDIDGERLAGINDYKMVDIK